MAGLKIEKKYKTTFDIARKYYAFLFDLNEIKLNKSEIDLVTYCSLNGTFSTPPVRQEFIRIFEVHKNTVYNILAKLQKKGILIKDKDKKIRVNPRIVVDFNQPLLLQVKLSLETNDEKA